MADVRYEVSVDSSGAITQIKALDKAWDDLNKTGKETAEGAGETEQAQGSLWQSMALGQIVAQATMKAFRELTRAFKESIGEAIGQEDADNRLRAALETTGRTVQGNIQVYKQFAAEKMALTKYTDDEVEASEALLLQMTHLNQEGIKRAIEGAMGLSAVMGTDLQSATLMVTKAMEGNYTALQRVGITVDESLGPQEKQAALLEKLRALYPRAEAELRTFGGAVVAMKRDWSEAQEAFGTGIIQNESLKDSIKSISGILKAFAPELKEFGEGIGQLLGDIANMGIKAIEWINKVRTAVGGNRSYLTDEEQAWKKVNEKLGGFSEASQRVIAQLSRMGVSYEELDTLRAKFLEGMNEVGSRDALKAMAEGKYGEKVAEAMAVVGGEALKVAKSLTTVPPVVNETGRAADIAAAALTKLKGELKAAFTSDITAEIARIEEGLIKFGDSLTPASLAGFQKRLEELRSQLPKTFSGVDLAGPINDQTEMILEDLYGVGVAALFMKGKVTDSSKDIEAGLAVVTARAAAYDARMKALAGPTMTELRTQANEIREVLRKSGDDMPIERVKELEAELKRLGLMMRRDTALDDWAEKANAAMDKVAQAWATVSQSMTGVLDQAQRNREIAIENEYKKRLAVINSTIKDETKKNAAITALESEFQIKRTQAQAAGAKQAKAVALMEAVVNTASGVARAFKDYAFPLSAVIAGIVGALGAVQIALIAKQPIPLARGAVFTKPTMMTTSEGRTFEMGEEGVEYLVPEKHLAGLAKGLYGAPRGLSGAFAGGSGAVINFNSPLIQTSGLADADLMAAGDRLYRIIDRKLRAGRR